MLKRYLHRPVYLGAAFFVLLVVALASCTHIPEPDSPGGRLYTERCATGCHGAYQPRSMKYAMWKIMVRRMEGEIVRHGMPPLTDKEEALLLDYLKRHSD